MNIHIYPSTFTNESRILKVTRSLREHRVFEKIMVLAVWKEGLSKREVLGNGIEVLRVAPLFGGSISGTLGRLCKVVGWYLGVLWALRGKEIGCFNCHSLPVLPLSVLIKLWKRCALIYEPHELETETAGLGGARQWVMRLIEKSLIGRADAVCVVNHSIADWYTTRYLLKKAWVVRNVPYRSEAPPLRTGALRGVLRLPDETPLFLYQGLLARGRGIGLLIEVFSQLPDKHLVFMGYGDQEVFVREAVAQYKNIHFVPAVPPEQVKDYTVDTDVGIAVIENVCLSYYLCLPNKLFEYATCGVPALVSDFPEMERFIDEYDCGWKVAPNPAALRQLVESFTLAELAAKRSNTHESAGLYCWQEEEKRLLTMYQALGFYVQDSNLRTAKH